MAISASTVAEPNLDELIAECDEHIAALEAELREKRVRRAELLLAKQKSMKTNEIMPVTSDETCKVGIHGADPKEESDDDGKQSSNFVGHGIAMDLARDCLKSGDLKHAKQILEGLVKQDAKFFDALLELAFVSDVAHDQKQFEYWIDRALAVNPLHAKAWIYKGMCEERCGNLSGAERAYSKAEGLDIGGAVGNDATQQLSILRRNMGCPLLDKDVWNEAAPRISAQSRRKQPIEMNGEWLVPSRPLFRGRHCIRAWDDMFGDEMLRCLHDSVTDFSTYLHRNPKHARTFWLDKTATPRTAAELAGRILLERLGHEVDEFAGIEWWCKSQSANLGAHFHYDMAVADGGYFRPTYSSVLYLADEGGPTVVLDQASDKHHVQWPEIPQEGYVVMPRINRWMTFPGELRHGMVPIDDDPRPRLVILYNFWSSYRPSPPNCQPPDLTNYLPLCAKSPTSRHLLLEEQLASLRSMEEGRKSEPVCIPIDTLERAAEYECSSSFGELPLALPMPSLRRMRNGPRDAGVFFLPWRRIAREYVVTTSLASEPSLAKRHFPTLEERLPFWEVKVSDDSQRLERRAAAIRAWLESGFVEKACGLAEAELVKAVERNSDDTKLGLVSLSKYIQNELNLVLKPSELDGAFFTQNLLCVRAKTCSQDTLHNALYSVLTTKVLTWCAECHRTPQCSRVDDPQHGLVLNLSGLMSSVAC